MTTMLYKPGAMITCGPHSLDYVIVDDDQVEAHIDKGWAKHPDDVVFQGKGARGPKVAKDGDED